MKSAILFVSTPSGTSDTNEMSETLPTPAEKLEQIENVQNEITELSGRLEQNRLILEQNRDLLQTLRDEFSPVAQIAEQNIRRNHFGIDPNFPAEQYFGNEYLKWIDERGAVHIFTVQTDGVIAFRPADRDLTFHETTNGYEITRIAGPRWMFDEHGLLTAKCDPNQRCLYFRRRPTSFLRVLFGENPRFVVTEISDDAGRSWELEYENDLLVNVTDPLGGTQIYEYDETGHLTRHTNAAGLASHYEWNPDHTLAAHINPHGGLNRYFYRKINGRPRVVRETDPFGAERFFEYHFPNETEPVNGLHYSAKTVYRDRRGSETTYFFDQRGNTIRILHPDGVEENFAYDQARNLVWHRDGEGHATKYEYNAQNQVTRIVFPDRNAETRVYENGFLARRVDPVGGVYVYLRDERGNLLEEHRPDGTWMNAEYASGEQPARLRENNGRVIEERRDPSGGTLRYVFNPRGFITGVTDQNGGFWLREVDGNGRTTGLVDPLGNRKVFDPNGGETEYYFDLRDRIVRIKNALGGETSYGYGPFDNRNYWRDPTGRELFAQFDERNRIVSLRSIRSAI